MTWKLVNEEFITILKEKDKHEKMKENVKNISKKLEEEKEKTKNMRLNSVNSRTTSLQTCNFLKSIEDLHRYDDYYDFYEYYDDFFLIEYLNHQKKIIFFVCVCIKCLILTKKHIKITTWKQ